MLLCGYEDSVHSCLAAEMRRDAEEPRQRHVSGADVIEISGMFVICQYRVDFLEFIDIINVSTQRD